MNKLKTLLPFRQYSKNRWETLFDTYSLAIEYESNKYFAYHETSKHTRAIGVYYSLQEAQEACTKWVIELTINLINNLKNKLYPYIDV